VADIFISYARPDVAAAEDLERALEQEGWTVWRDVAIPAGEDLRQTIERELGSAGCVLVLWSRASVASQWVCAEASTAGKRLLPVLIEEVALPLPFNETNTARLVGWRGNRSALEYQMLKSSIQSMLARGPRLPRPPPTWTAPRKRSVFAQRLERFHPTAILVPLTAAAVAYILTSHDEQARNAEVGAPNAALTGEQQQPVAATTTREAASAALGRLKPATEPLEAQLSSGHKASPNPTTKAPTRLERGTTPILTRVPAQCPGTPFASEEHRAALVGDVPILKGAGVMQLYGMSASKSRAKPHVGIKILFSSTRRPMAQATVFEGQALPFTYCEQQYEARVTTIIGQDRLATIAVSSVPGGS
jgi:hypothetical protein